MAYTTPSRTENKVPGLAFGRSNYLWMLISLVTVIVGYLLMQGGASTDPDVFSDAIFSTRRITIAPIVVLTGYGMMFYALLKRP